MWNIRPRDTIAVESLSREWMSLVHAHGCAWIKKSFIPPRIRKNGVGQGITDSCHLILQLNNRMCGLMWGESVVRLVTEIIRCYPHAIANSQ